MCEVISNIVEEFGAVEKDDLFTVYKYLTKIYWKEDVDFVFFDKFNFEFGERSIEKRIKQDQFRKNLIHIYYDINWRYCSPKNDITVHSWIFDDEKERDENYEGYKYPLNSEVALP